MPFAPGAGRQGPARQSRTTAAWAPAAKEALTRSAPGCHTAGSSCRPTMRTSCVTSHIAPVAAPRSKSWTINCALRKAGCAAAIARPCIGPRKRCPSSRMSLLPPQRHPCPNLLQRRVPRQIRLPRQHPSPLPHKHQNMHPQHLGLIGRLTLLRLMRIRLRPPHLRASKQTPHSTAQARTQTAICWNALPPSWLPKRPLRTKRIRLLHTTRLLQRLMRQPSHRQIQVPRQARPLRQSCHPQQTMPALLPTPPRLPPMTAPHQPHQPHQTQQHTPAQPFCRQPKHPVCPPLPAPHRQRTLKKHPSSHPTPRRRTMLTRQKNPLRPATQASTPSTRLMPC